MYVSQPLSTENWSKSPDSNERVYREGIFLWNLNFFFIFLLTTVFYKKNISLICWTNFILQIQNQRFGLIAQTPTHESTKQEMFLQILDFFFLFSSWELRWPPFSTKTICLICWTNFINYRYWIKDLVSYL
jgi:hypothetical protein